MVLTLYHDDLEPHKVYNVIKMMIDNNRMVTVHIKHGVNITHYVFLHGEHYQRLTVQVD